MGEGRACGGRGRGLSLQELTVSQSSVQHVQHGRGARRPFWKETVGSMEGHSVPRGPQGCRPSSWAFRSPGHASPSEDLGEGSF